MDLVRAITNDRLKFARAVVASKLPVVSKRQLLMLTKRSQEQLERDVIAAYFIREFGSSPIEHEHSEIPREFLPKELDEWLTTLRE